MASTPRHSHACVSVVLSQQWYADCKSLIRVSPLSSTKEPDPQTIAISNLESVLRPHRMLPSTNLYDKMLTSCNIITASNDSVIPRDNIHINHSFLTSFSSVNKIQFSTRKLKEYDPHQSADSKNSVDLHLQENASADHTSCRSLQYILVRPPSYPCRLTADCTSQYRDMKCHDISISSLGYDMNPTIINTTTTSSTIITTTTFTTENY